ncbi:MAG: tRNA (guanosine(37)-N1)-methyltransferase TrmD [Methylacidiphilales bacterium]|nr:tRNA (guanosine(37)-N1)-methyltransferase TrmD [Candidatus Methylacidiphilales bacterium]
MRIDVITLFPEILRGPLDASILGRAQRGGQVDIQLHQLRDYATDKHRTVDEKPYGGGPGMLLKCEPIFAAVEDVQTKAEKPGRIILLTPGGSRFDQAKARELTGLDRIVFVCGHYEGVDERVREHLVDEELSLGDFILTNGALAALVVIDAVVRLLPNVVGNEASTQTESFGADRPWLEGPQYTRPEEFRGWRVPEILLSGHHGKIEEWSHEQSRRRTERIRPDLLKLNSNQDPL